MKGNYFETKKLSTNPDTQIEKTQDLKNVVTDMIFKPKQDLIKVAGVAFRQFTNACCVKHPLNSMKALKFQMLKL